MKITILIFFILVSSFSLFSCKDEIVLSTDSGSYAGNTDHAFQLYPGMSFVTGLYCWSNGTSINSELVQKDQMGWMNISNGSFTSSGCSDVKYVSFDIRAPLLERTYSTLIKDSKRHLSDYKWDLVVTKNPTINVTNQTVNINAGDSITISDVVSYNGINTSNFNNNCVANPYYISSSMHIKISFSENYDWVKYSTMDTVVYSGSPLTIKKTFKNNIPGTYTFFEFLQKEWFSFPFYKKWTIIVS